MTKSMRGSVRDQSWSLKTVRVERPLFVPDSSDVQQPGVPERRASKKLIDLDRELRTKLQGAANATIKRALEKAGARVLNKMRSAQHTALRASLTATPPALIVGRVGPALVASLGLHERDLLDTEFHDLHHQWNKWVAEAQLAAINIAASITNSDATNLAASKASELHAIREDGWVNFRTSVNTRAVDAMQNIDEINPEELDTYNFAPVGDVRAAVAIAGGYLLREGSSGINEGGFPVDPAEPLTGIGNGPIVEDVLTTDGASIQTYEWIHGASNNPFEPHLELDGVEFSTFDAPILANEGSFPDSAFYMAGDHDGCSCDFMPIWYAEGDDENA